jgi:hypothetical protein
MIKNFSCFLNEGIRDDVRMAKEYAMDVYNGEDYAGMDYDEIEERLIDFARNEFPYGLQKIPKKLILYRIINVKSEKDINKINLGKHYVGDKDMILDSEFLFSASLLSGDPIHRWFIITIKTTPDNLDYRDMLGNRAEYPLEYEYSLLNDKDLEILNIEEIDPNEYN